MGLAFADEIRHAKFIGNWTDIASDIRGLRKVFNFTELKNFTIAQSMFMVVDIQI